MCLRKIVKTLRDDGVNRGRVYGYVQYGQNRLLAEFRVDVSTMKIYRASKNSKIFIVYRRRVKFFGFRFQGGKHLIESNRRLS